jgi:O-antigen ligase
MRDVRRVGVVVAAAVAPVQFLVFDPQGWFPFGPIRWLTGSVLVLVSLAAILATRRVVFDRPTGWAWGALLVLLGVGAAFGLEERYAWLGTPERMLGWATWLLFLAAFVVGQSVVARSADGDGDADAVDADRFVLGGLVLAALGVGLVASAEAIGVEVDAIAVAGDRLTATFGNASFLGAAGALLLPVTIGVAMDPTRPTVARWVSGVAAASTAVAVVGSGARAAWVGLVAAALVAASFRRASVRPRSLLFAAVLGAVAVAGLVAFTPVGDRVASAFDDGAPGGVGRVDEWRVAARVLGANPVNGVGPEGYRIAFEEGVDAEYEREHGRDPLPDRAHSAPLDVALAGGIPAAVAYLVLLALVGRSCVRVLARGSRSRAGLAAGLVAHGVGSLFLFPTFEIDLVVWLLAGVVVSWSVAPGDEARSVRVPLVAAGAAAGAAVVALVVGVSGVRADRSAARALDASAEGRPEAAVADADAAVRLRPDVLRYRLLAARVGIAAGEGWSAAIADVDAALEISPGDPIARRFRAEALVQRAKATLAPAHVEAARVAVDRLITDDPFLAEARLLDGDLSLVEGDEAGAAAAYERAAELESPDGTD